MATSAWCSTRSDKAVDGIVGQGAARSSGLEDMVRQLPSPKVVWVMLPAGHITEETVQSLGKILDEGRHYHRRRQHDVP